jgi:hypothetical protein
MKTTKSAWGAVAGTVLAAVLVISSADAALVTGLDVTFNTSLDYVEGLHVTVGDQSANELIYGSALTANYVCGAPIPTGTTSPFTTFCVAVLSDLRTTGFWQAEPTTAVNAAGQGYLDSTRLDRAANLYDAFAGEVNSTSQSGLVAGAALQLAIWDALYGTDLTSVSDSSSTFYITPFGKFSGDSIAKANFFLSQPANNAGPNGQATFWLATDEFGNPGGNQNLLGPPDPPLVPEPSTWWGAGAAVICAAVVTIRRLRRRDTVPA